MLIGLLRVISQTNQCTSGELLNLAKCCVFRVTFTTQTDYASSTVFPSLMVSKDLRGNQSWSCPQVAHSPRETHGDKKGKCVMGGFLRPEKISTQVLVVEVIRGGLLEEDISKLRTEGDEKGENGEHT
jgi:hypothetical protein